MEVPQHLKGSNYSGAKKLGHGTGYKYPHDYPEGKNRAGISEEEKKKYYKP